MKIYFEPKMIGLAVSCTALALSGCLGSKSARVGQHQPAVYASSTSSQSALLELADEFYERENFAAAIPLYRRAYGIDKQSAKAILGYGKALMAAGHYTQAIELYRAVDAPTQEIYASQGAALLALDEPAQAIEMYRSAMQRYPRHAPLHEGRAMALDALGRHAEAVESFYRALALDPANLRTRNNFGLSLAVHGEYDKAIPLLEIVATDPKATAKHRQNLALAYGLAGRFDEAARTSSIDLDAQAVRDNLTYFSELQAMDAESRRHVLMSGGRTQIASASEPAQLVFDDRIETVQIASARRHTAEEAIAVPTSSVQVEALPEPVEQAVAPAKPVRTGESIITIASASSQLRPIAKGHGEQTVAVQADPDMLTNERMISITASTRAMPAMSHSAPVAAVVTNEETRERVITISEPQSETSHKPLMLTDVPQERVSINIQPRKNAAAMRVVSMVDDHKVKSAAAKPDKASVIPASFVEADPLKEAIRRNREALQSPFAEMVNTVEVVFGGLAKGLTRPIKQ